jgi:alkanesulfonate monooxygenase SsuD/methylene tetrahydromethanopterin reductase-like flavin-dependent oxidoreductase (luciferase family)
MISGSSLGRLPFFLAALSLMPVWVITGASCACAMAAAQGDAVIINPAPPATARDLGERTCLAS